MGTLPPLLIPVRGPASPLCAGTFQGQYLLAGAMIGSWLKKVKSALPPVILAWTVFQPTVLRYVRLGESREPRAASRITLGATEALDRGAHPCRVVHLNTLICAVPSPLRCSWSPGRA